MTEAAPLAFIFFAATAAEEHDDFALALQIGELASDLASRISSNTIKSGSPLIALLLGVPLTSVVRRRARVTVLYGVMNRTFAPASILATPARLETGLQFALAAGERTYSCFAQLHRISYNLVANVHLSDSLVFAEEAMSDIFEVRLACWPLLSDRHANQLTLRS